MAPAARPLQRLLAEKLADSLAATLPDLTPRRVFGAVSLPGKATAVVGVRRAGKTCFLHQLRRTRLEQGAARERLPYVSFEDERSASIRRRATSSCATTWTWPCCGTSSSGTA